MPGAFYSARRPRLVATPRSHTMCDMKGAVTIGLDRELERSLNRICSLSRRSWSEVVRDTLRPQLSLQAFEALRHRMIPLAEARGYFTDEDVFKPGSESPGPGLLNPDNADVAPPRSEAAHRNR